MKDTLPSGWVETEFINLVSKEQNSIKRGPFGSAIKKSFFVLTGYKVYEQQNAIKDDSSLGNYYINQEKFKELKGFSVSSGDYLISCSGTIGKIIRLPQNCEEGVINQALLKIRLNHTYIDSIYFLNLFRSHVFQKIILKDTRGSGMKNLASVKDIKRLKMQIPPLNEQKRIVTKIEELFSELDKGIESLKKAKEQLTLYRQAVLKQAFDNNEINWVSLGEVCKNVEYGTSSKSQKVGKVPVLRMGNIQNGRFDWADLVYTSDVEEVKKYQLMKDDVLFNRTNSPELVGKTAIYKEEQPAIFAGYLIRVNYLKEHVIGDYLNYYLNSHDAKKYGNTVKSDGVNQSNINGTKLKKYPFPLCSVEHQLEIVKFIETQFSAIDQLESDINTNLKKAETLRQSILKKAFSGELVPQNPNDLPASVLLEKIKAEKAKLKPSKKRKKGATA
jgi:type I restriction enzyme S subunit